MEKGREVKEREREVEKKEMVEKEREMAEKERKMEEKEREREREMKEREMVEKEREIVEKEKKMKERDIEEKEREKGRKTRETEVNIDRTAGDMVSGNRSLTMVKNGVLPPHEFKQREWEWSEELFTAEMRVSVSFCSSNNPIPLSSSPPSLFQG